MNVHLGFLRADPSTKGRRIRSNPVRGWRCGRIRAKKGGTAEDGEFEKISIGLGLASFAIASFVVLATKLPNEWLEDAIYGDVYSVNEGGSLSLATVSSTLLWTVALYHATPLQALLLFLGKIDEQRPSDQVLLRFRSLLEGKKDRNEEDVAFLSNLLTWSFFLVAGMGVTAGLRSWTDGDTTWSVSTGIGFAMISGVYELGRPPRLSREDELRLERMWHDFRLFAEENLLSTGRCHVSEVEKRFRSTCASYRSKESFTDDELRNLIANWAPQADRTPSGYYKGLSLRPKQDPFR